MAKGVAPSVTDFAMDCNYQTGFPFLFFERNSAASVAALLKKLYRCSGNQRQKRFDERCFASLDLYRQFTRFLLAADL